MAAAPRSDLDACSIHEWLPTLKRVTIKTILIRLPPPIIAYLTTDAPFFLPAGSDSDDDDRYGNDSPGVGTLSREAKSADSPPSTHEIEPPRCTHEMRALCADIDAAIHKCALSMLSGSCVSF